MLNWLGEAKVHAASEKTYLQAQVEAPKQEAEIRDRMEIAEYRDEKTLSEQSSAPRIQTRLDAIDKRLQELPATPVTIEPDLQPSQFEATQWAALAERMAINKDRLTSLHYQQKGWQGS